MRLGAGHTAWAGRPASEPDRSASALGEKISRIKFGLRFSPPKGKFYW